MLLKHALVWVVVCWSFSWQCCCYYFFVLVVVAATAVACAVLDLIILDLVAL